MLLFSSYSMVIQLHRQGRKTERDGHEIFGSRVFMQYRKIRNFTNKSKL